MSKNLIASISVPAAEKEDLNQKWDVLLGDLGDLTSLEGKPVKRSKMVRQVIDTGTPVNARQLSELSAKALRQQDRTYVVFYIEHGK